MPSSTPVPTLQSRLRRAVWLRVFVAFIILCNVVGAHACVGDDLAATASGSAIASVQEAVGSLDSVAAPESGHATLGHALAAGSCGHCACHHGCVVGGSPTHDFQASPTSSGSFSARAAKPSPLEPSLRPPIL